MEVILLEKVENLGGLGDRVNVKAGFGRNYLLPQGKAMPATVANIAEFEARRAELEKAAGELLQTAEKRGETVTALATITIAAKTGDEGKLFGSIGTADIAAAIVAAGVDVTRTEIRLSDGAFRAVGEYDVNIHLHTDVDVSIKLVIESEE